MSEATSTPELGARGVLDLLAVPGVPEGSEMPARVQAMDWSRTALGPPERWSPALRMTVRTVLANRFPMMLWWSSDHICIYNDAYRPILGVKHPRALGLPVRDVWREIWHILRPLIDTPFQGGQATWNDDIFLELDRNGFLEETHFTIAYSPVPDDSTTTGIGGVLATVNEITEQVVGHRRVAALRDLGARMGEAKSAEEACAIIAESLVAHRRDVPFALLYLMDADKQALQLAGSVGVERGQALSPLSVDLSLRWEGGWPFADAVRSEAQHVVDRLQDRFEGVPPGPWSDPPHTAVVMTVPSHKSREPAGVLVLGVSSRLAYEEHYRDFFELLRTQVATAIANARAHEEERKRADALAALDRAKIAFFSNVSHEFRTPLTLMLAPLEEMRARAEKTHEEREQVELLHRNALRLLKLVNTLLDFSRIEAGRVEARYVPADLATLTTDLASSFRSLVERAGLALAVQCPPLPESFHVDEDMWEKIVLNLISNAFKFTFDGSITVSLGVEDEHAVLRVSDTGIGIAAQDLPRIFERFHRVEGARSRSHEGSGIGLALVHSLVRLHGGTIEVTSAPGVGTTFEVRIPRGSAHLPQEQLRAERAAHTTAIGADAFLQEAMRWVGPAEWPRAMLGAVSSPERQRHRIVYADDNADMRDYVLRLLRDRWDVDAVADGQAALELMRSRPPDLLLADVMMPRLDGFGLLRAVRADPQLWTTPVVLLSARAGEEATAQGLEAGADDYIVKPFAASDLLVRIAARLTSATARGEERKRLLKLLAQVPAIVNFLRGPELVFEFAHPKAIETLAGREVLGKPVLEVMPELRGQPHYAHLKRVYETGEPFAQHEAMAWHFVDGRRRETYWNSVYLPVRDAAGAVEGVMTFDIDVTASVVSRIRLEKAHQATANALRDLERADRAKDEFLATLSHELRTPLNAMLGWAALLREGPRDEGKLARGLDVIERNARAQERIVSDLLDMSRIISGKLQLSMGPTEVAEVIQATADVVRPGAASKGVQLAVDVGPEVGAIIADAGRLQQVLWNLLINAIRFTPRGGHITVRAALADAIVRITVEDTGQGVSSDHLPHVFERFRQVDSSITRSHGGLGLGLAIVRHIVEAHGGTVAAASDGIGKGATFTVLLPVRAVELGAAGRTATSGAAPNGSRSEPPARVLGGVTVLAVDDDEDSLDLIRSVLEAAGARVTAVRSGKEALETRGRYDVIVSDIGMPELDGYTLLQRIRAREVGRDTPALALTAYARTQDAERARRAGYQEHLHKPIDAAKLVQAVGRWSRLTSPTL